MVQYIFRKNDLKDVENTKLEKGKIKIFILHKNILLVWKKIYLCSLKGIIVFLIIRDIYPFHTIFALLFRISIFNISKTK